MISSASRIATLESEDFALEIRVRGAVQGVGFRPTVWRLARACGLAGQVSNDGDGVRIEVEGRHDDIARFLKRLTAEAPPLARIDRIDQGPLRAPTGRTSFFVAESSDGEMHTNVIPDAAMCADCRAETLSPFERRFRYPFTNCTQCGPRFSIIETSPYDRASTTMRWFDFCAECALEYGDPADRRFHAEPIACHVCGPKATLIRLDGRAVHFEQHSMLDDVDAAGSLIAKGEIVAIKGIGGFHLACDATNANAVAKLRDRKHRYRKPFAMMARDLDVIRRYAIVSEAEAELLASPQAPIVLLRATGQSLPDGVAPGLDTLGFMLPYAPLHTLIFRRLERPAVMTSGNLSDEPQVIGNEQAKAKLAAIADYALLTDREIANRVDDSVVRVMAGAPRILRRARGYAPSSIPLPPGFEDAPDLLAVGGELKAAFCLVKDGAAILSQHQGDLEEVAAFEDFQKNIHLYAQLFDHQPQLVATDLHPEYLSRKLALDLARERALPLVETQHHHAHIASCLAENGRPLTAPPVLGIALDGVGYGADGTIWGGEFLLADYLGFERVGTLKPVAMPGGAQAVREPWRNTYAHLMAEIGWPRFALNWNELDLFNFLEQQPRQTLDAMIKGQVNSPLASSCGRLFDAVAAAVGLARDHAAYEGEGAMLFEAAVDHDALENEDEDLAYPFSIPKLKRSGLRYIEPVAMWQALLGDLILRTPVPVIAARFHRGLAKAIAQMAGKVAEKRDEGADPIDTVALSGGCLQNRVLLEEVDRRLRGAGFVVLMHAKAPANDGGLALGQAAIAAAHAIKSRSRKE
ncbi:MAG: carbamoyltransferase HypF [Hyphomicrobium sp.]